MVTKLPSGVVLEAYRDMIDVTSNHRPDIFWVFTDDAKHVHRWCTNGKPVEGYNPSETYSIPSVEWVKDGVNYYPDGSEYEIGHYECKLCRETIDPGYTADRVTQYVPGLTHYLVNGHHVSEEEFTRFGSEARESVI